MAERNFDFLETLGRKKRVVCGRFKPNDASALDQTQTFGTGFTVLYGGPAPAGTYDVTFTDRYARVLYAKATLVQATRTQEVEISSCDPAAGTMVIQSFAKGNTVLQDVTAAAATYITFVCVMDDTTPDL